MILGVDASTLSSLMVLKSTRIELCGNYYTEGENGDVDSVAQRRHDMVGQL